MLAQGRTGPSSRQQWRVRGTEAGAGQEGAGAAPSPGPPPGAWAALVHANGRACAAQGTSLRGVNHGAGAGGERVSGSQMWPSCSGQEPSRPRNRCGGTSVSLHSLPHRRSLGKHFCRFFPQGEESSAPLRGPQAGRPGLPTLSCAALCWSLHASGPRTSAHRRDPRRRSVTPAGAASDTDPPGVPAATRLHLPSHCLFPEADTTLPCRALPLRVGLLSPCHSRRSRLRHGHPSWAP